MRILETCARDEAANDSVGAYLPGHDRVDGGDYCDRSGGLGKHSLLPGKTFLHGPDGFVAHNVTCSSRATAQADDLIAIDNTCHL
jgi:hypothetical protein